MTTMRTIIFQYAVILIGSSNLILESRKTEFQPFENDVLPGRAGIPRLLLVFLPAFLQITRKEARKLLAW